MPHPFNSPDVITIIFGEEAPHYAISPASLLGPNIILSTLFSDILSLC
jgi:hypothetical protein